MGSVVVVAAEQGGVVEVGGAAGGPGVGVVGLAPGGGDGAALGLALVVTQPDGFALGGAVESP